MGTLRKNFGAHIRRIRKGKKMSQEDLAERAGVSPAYISQLETGKLNPTLVTIEKIVQGLDIGLPQAFGFLYAKTITSEQIKEHLIGVISKADDLKIQALFDAIININHTA